MKTVTKHGSDLQTSCQKETSRPGKRAACSEKKFGKIKEDTSQSYEQAFIKSQITEMRDLRLFKCHLQEILLFSFLPLFELEGIYAE